MKKLLIFLTLFCLLLSLTGCGGNSYKDAVTDYLNVHRAGETKKLEELAPKQVIEQQIADKKLNIETRKNDIEEYYNGLLKSLKSSYGEDYKFKVKVNGKENKDNKLNDIKKRLNERYDIKENSVKQVIEANFTITHHSSTKEKSFDSKILVVKIDGGWYVCNENGDFGIENNLLNY